MMRRRLAVTYFYLQAAAVAAWWVMLAGAPATRLRFAHHDAPFVTLGAFATGDILVIALGSALVAWRHGVGWAAPLTWMVTGGILYAAAYAVTIAAVHGGPSLGALLMAPAAACTVVAAIVLSRDGRADTLPPGPAA